ncbi:HNH endonuclease [Williamsia sp. CHRR-6]|nr:HNH endonuclease [Williamsia sp. CHRR-6]
MSTPIASATPPAIPSAATARSELDQLTIAPEGSMTGYSRAEFPHWITQFGACDTRETVLKRDGTGVSVGTDCYPTAGSWRSPYDGVTLAAAADVDVDHIVPLAEAWRSGAAEWTTARRQSFANDLTHAQLIAVSASSNRSKGDQDPSTWLPPVSSYRCTYARMWVGSKFAWDLTLQQSEYDRLSSILDGC